MYVRIKRKNQTIFLYTDANEKIQDLKGKIVKINVEDKKVADNVSLIFADNHLDHDKTVGEAKIENDSVVYLVYKKEGANDWEEVDVQKTKTEGEEKKE